MKADNEAKQFCLEAWGKYACFSMVNPERMSYPVPTPSAVRGIFDAIYWHPGMKWQPDKIEILSMPKYQAVPFNGVAAVVNIGNPVPIDVSEERQQLQLVALCDVHYRLHAHIELFEENRGLRNKFESIYQRYSERGQCVHQPYFGIREMAAFFKPTTDSTTKPVNYSTVIPNMLYDVFDLSANNYEARNTLDISKVRKISLFDARVFDGVMEIPAFESSLVKKVSRSITC